MRQNFELKRPFIIVYHSYRKTKDCSEKFPKLSLKQDDISAYLIDSVSDDSLDKILDKNYLDKIIRSYREDDGSNVTLLGFVPNDGPDALENLELLCRFYAKQMKVRVIRRFMRY